MANQKQLLNKLRDEINSDFTPKGSHKPVASLGDDFDYVNAIPTFSPTLDYLLGIGGWPEGKLIEIFGKEYSGKSTMAILALKDCYDYYKGKKVVGYIDIEHRFNKEWAEKLGFVVGENLLVVQPEDAESGTDVMTRMIKSDLFCAIVWDSIGAAATSFSKQELTEKKSKPGGNAAVMGRCVQTNGPLANLYDVTIFMINQLRDDMDGRHQLIRPGGHAVKHQMSVVLYLRPGTEKYFDKVNGEDLQVGFPIMIKTLKNSYGPALIQGWTDFYNQPSQYLDHIGIDYESDLYRISILLGVVKKAASWYSWKEFKEQGADKLLRKVVESNRKEELLADVRSAIKQGSKRDRSIEQELESEFGKKLFDGPDINDPEI
jgi:recombination protein RecA